MKNFRAYEIMEIWLKTYLKKILDSGNPNFNWIIENLEAYKRLEEAIFKLPDEEDEPNDWEEE